MTKKEKILLCNPVTRSGKKVLRVERCQQKVLPAVGLWPPITLLEIAVYLRHRGFHNIDILDGEIEGFSFEELVKEILCREPSTVIIQATTPTIEDDVFLARRLKQKNKDLRIIFTGLHATVFPRKLLEEEAVDFAVQGEPEETICELMESLSGEGRPLGEIRGLAYRNGVIKVNERRKSRVSYDYPVLPDRSLLKNERYIMPFTGKKFSVVKVSRGCDSACSFCTSRSYYGRGWRARSVGNIIAEIREVKETCGIDTFLFLCDTFNADKDFVKNLTRRIIDERLDIRWVSNSRVDVVDEETAALMKESGCMLLSLGIESFDERVLHRNRKYIKGPDILRGIDILKKHDIMTYGYFIFGLEGQTKKTVVNTIFQTVCSSLDFAHFYSLTPYPGTDYFNRFPQVSWNRYYHGVSDIVQYKGLGRYFVGLSCCVAPLLFYLPPRRLKRIVLYLLRKKCV